MSRSVSVTILLAASPQRVWETVMDPSQLERWVTTHDSVAGGAVDGLVKLQVGAGTSDTIDTSVADIATGTGMAAVQLVDNTDNYVNFSTTLTLDNIDSAIKEISTARSGFGAVQNRLEHRLNNLATYQENLVASESRIRDVDMASEMVNFSKLQILQQAGTAMLAQANQSSQGVLSLLR